MLEIRKEQMVVFETLFKERFRSMLTRHARDELAAETESMNDVELEELIDEAVIRGKAYGIVSERDVMLFFDLLILQGQDFDQRRKFQWMSRILADESVDGTTKMDSIYGRLAALENRETQELEEMG